MVSRGTPSIARASAGRIEPRCIYQASTADGCRLVPADVEVATVIANPAGQHRVRSTSISPAASASP